MSDLNWLDRLREYANGPVGANFSWEDAGSALEEIERLTAELSLYRTGKAYTLAADEIERLQAIVAAHDKFAWLCYQDYGFWGNGGNDTPVPCLLLNDVFVPAADAFELSWDQVSEVYEIAKNGTPQDVWDWVKPLHLAATEPEGET